MLANARSQKTPRTLYMVQSRAGLVASPGGSMLHVVLFPGPPELADGWDGRLTVEKTENRERNDKKTENRERKDKGGTRVGGLCRLGDDGRFLAWK